MDEFTRKRYDKEAEEYIDLLLTHGLLEASNVLKATTLDTHVLMQLVTDKLRDRGYRIKGERNEQPNSD